MPAFVPGSVLGRGGATPPSERIRMGFIGLGQQGTGHLLGGAWTHVPGGYVARDDVQVLAVCDVSRERRESAQRRSNDMYAQRLGTGSYRGVEAYNDFRDVLARPDIDAVLLALPYHWAAPMATMAAQAGKDVFCEKPIAITVDEARNLARTCRRYGRVFQAGTQQRSEYGGKFRLACELVRSGRIGQLREVYAFRRPGVFLPSAWTSAVSRPLPDGLDWDLWLGPLPWRPYPGHAGHALPGMYRGDVNWSPHHYDTVAWVVDQDPAATVQIEYEPGVPFLPGGGPIAGTSTWAGDGHVHYHLSNGVVVHSTPYPGAGVGMEGGACFVGSEGRIAVDRSNIVSEPASILTTPLRPEEVHLPKVDSHSSNFLESVRSRRPPICHVDTAVRSIEMILAGGTALALQRSVRWDPRSGTFPGDQEANRLLAYTPRPPWRW